MMLLFVGFMHGLSIEHPEEVRNSESMDVFEESLRGPEKGCSGVAEVFTEFPMFKALKSGDDL
jgi:hypothetical protein